MVLDFCLRYEESFPVEDTLTDSEEDGLSSSQHPYNHLLFAELDCSWSSLLTCELSVAGWVLFPFIDISFVSWRIWDRSGLIHVRKQFPRRDGRQDCMECKVSWSNCPCGKTLPGFSPRTVLGHPSLCLTLQRRVFSTQICAFLLVWLRRIFSLSCWICISLNPENNCF